MHVKIKRIYIEYRIWFYRELGTSDFPIIATCTLQGFSATQGNPVVFTAKTFAVWSENGQKFPYLIKERPLGLQILV